MKNSSTKIIGSIVFMLIAIPQIAFAAWWNPFTWNIFSIFNKTPKAQVQQVQNATTTSNNDAEITAPQKKEAVKPKTTPSAPTKTINDQPKPQIQNPQPIVTETWEQQEVRDFAYADVKGWTSLTSTNALGEKRYYRKEGTQWIRKNRESEATQPYIASTKQDFTRPLGAPSVEQLRGLMWLCGYSAELEQNCATTKFVEYYFTNTSFRSLTDRLIVYAKQKLTEQQSQNEAARQAYLQYLQYTSYTPPAIPPRIETYSIPIYSGGLKLDLPPVETNRRWEVQWAGDGGGFITNTSGNTTYFQCTTGKCFSL